MIIRLRHLLLLSVLSMAPAALAGTVTLHFDELGTSSLIDVNNLSIDGVTFQFSGSIPAHYNDTIGTPGNADLVSDPLLVGPTDGTLTLTFSSPTPFLMFDVAMFSGDTIPDAYTVTLLSGSASPIVEDNQTSPLLMFSESAFSYTGPVSSAVITFDSSSAPEFGLDNLTFATPEPSTDMLLGGALIGLVMWARRRVS